KISTFSLKLSCKNTVLPESRRFLIEHSVEEILLPLAKIQGVKLILRLLADETAGHHKLLIEVAGMEEEPLKSDKIDSIGMRIVSGKNQALSSSKKLGNFNPIVAILKTAVIPNTSAELDARLFL
ncbi:MAG: hypothetical protein K5873_08115, partial [Treponema sp.]|nr:hypothetical protein [Treponema sp.]